VSFDEYATPRAALGLAGVAMAAITMCALVVLPAKLEAASSVAAATSAAMAATERTAVAVKARDKRLHARVSGDSECNSTEDRS
jgi:hypothetical protein